MIAHALPFALSLTFLPFVVLAMIYGSVWSLVLFLYAFAMIPIADGLAGLSKANLDAGTEDRHLFFHRLLTWAWVPVQLFVIFAPIAHAGQTTAFGPGSALANMAAVGITGGSASPMRMS